MKMKTKIKRESISFMKNVIVNTFKSDKQHDGRILEFINTQRHQVFTALLIKRGLSLKIQLNMFYRNNDTG